MVDYFRYPDDILTVVDSTTTNVTEECKEFNNLDRNLNFKLERQGTGKKINFIHITITIQKGDQQFSVFRKLLPSTQ
jgi:hypothetical protein